MVADVSCVFGVQVAERRITDDLESLIDVAVDTSKADYAVCTGVQIHSWPDPATGAPAIEYVMPTKSYVVIDGKRTDIRLDAVPALSPRQLSLLSTGALKEVHPEDQLVNAYLEVCSLRLLHCVVPMCSHVPLTFSSRSQVLWGADCVPPAPAVQLVD